MLRGVLTKYDNGEKKKDEKLDKISHLYILGLNYTKQIL